MSLRLACSAVLLFALAATAVAETPAEKKAREAATKELAKVDAQLKKSPEDPMLHYRRAQFLMKLGKLEDGHAAAKKAMEFFIKKKDDLAWLLLESIDLGNVTVDVHFNMGERERKAPENGIVRPISFRVWKKGEKGEKGELLEVIDFEIGMMGGEAGTAAIGKKKDGGGHENFGMMKVDDTYTTIRTKALEVIGKRHPVEEKKEPEGK